MELRLHTRSKPEDGSSQAKTLLDVAAAAADTLVLGTLTKVGSICRKPDAGSNMLLLDHMHLLASAAQSRSSRLALPCGNLPAGPHA